MPRCMTASGGMKERRGTLKVRYAMVQGTVGYPVDGAPQGVLLLEDAAGWFHCDGVDVGWLGKGGDHFTVDHSASGFELPTISGYSSSSCATGKAATTVDSAVVLRTSPDAVAARMTVHAGGGARTAKVPTRDGYVFIPARVSGKAVRRSPGLTVELLSATGKRLPIQKYGQSVVRRLEYPLEPCGR